MLNLIFALAVLAAPGAPRPATNTLGPVLGNAVDAHSPKVVVRGQEYRICCKGCDSKLMTSPDTYLKPDGTPKNSIK